MRSKAGLMVAALVLLGLAGCSVPDAVNPVSWYRDVRGLSKNDNLGKGNNEQNLAEGDNEPYPNLANVPAAPDTALSEVDRDKLKDNLIADRNNAEYSNDNLHAGPTAPISVGLPSAAVAAAAQASPPPAPQSAPQSAAAQPPAPPPPEPQPAATAAAQPPPAPKVAENTPSATAPPAPATSPQHAGPPARGSQAPPAETPIASPTIPNPPQGEALMPAVPPPTLTPRPQPAPPNAVASAASPAASREAAPPSGLVQPASVPASASAASATETAARRPTVSHHAADVSFAPGSAWLSGALRGTIADIVKLYQKDGGTIRIVGHSEASGGDAGSAGRTLALDRAQAVAVALAGSGVPAEKIAVEAAPVTGDGGHGEPRAEVYIEN